VINKPHYLPFVGSAYGLGINGKKVMALGYSIYGEFLNLQDAGSELLANTSNGLYYSKNAGRSWAKR